MIAITMERAVDIATVVTGMAAIANTIIIGLLTRQYVNETKKLVAGQNAQIDAVLAAQEATRQEALTARVTARIDFIPASGGVANTSILTVANLGPHEATNVEARLLDPNDVSKDLGPMPPLARDLIMSGENTGEAIPRPLTPSQKATLRLAWTDGHGDHERILRVTCR